MTSLKLEPYKYQIEDMKFLLKNKKAALLHSPGVGKTFGALMAITYVLESYGGKALVIMPPILLNTWYDKIYDYFDTDLTTLIYKGTPTARAKIDFNKYRIVLVSFDLFQRDFDKFKQSKWAYVTIDETKYIKNGTVSRSKKTKRMNKFGAVQSLCSKVEYLTLMNGTPVTKSPEDIFHIIQLINPNVYVSKKNFLRHHAKYMPNDLGYPQIIGWKNLSLIEDLLKICSRRLIKSEVLDLPKKQLVIKQFSLESKHQSKLKELWDYGFIELEAKELDSGQLFLEGMSLMMNVRQAIIDPSLLGLDTKSTYFEMLEDLLEDLNGEQVIIFAHFHNTINLLRKFLAKKSFGELHGRVSSKQKDLAIEDFKARKFDILLANAKSAGVGLDLQQCHNVIFFELDYEVDSFWQGQDRVHRPGQDEEVNIFVFVAKNTPAVDLFRAVKTNVSYVSTILEGKEDSSKLFEDKITVKEEQAWKDL